MEPIHYLRALRHWWMLILALTAFGVLAAFLTAASAASPDYSATHTLVRNGSAESGATTLARAAFVATTEKVSSAVARDLGRAPSTFNASIQATTDVALDGLRLTATASSAKEAVLFANLFAKKLVASLDGQAAAAHEREVDAASSLVNTLAGQLSATPALALDRGSIESRYAEALVELQDLQASPPQPSFTTIESAAASPVAGATSTRTRYVVGTLMGALLGVIVALVLARFDTRIRTREQLEMQLELPVLAEIPVLRRRVRSTRSLVTRNDPESLAAESFRSLRTALLVSAQPRAESSARGQRKRRAEGGTNTPRREGGRVILVVSPGSGEAKTTTTANLGVAFGESGRRVLLVGADLRRPQLHQHFGLDESPGLTEFLQSEDPGRSLQSVIRPTDVPRVEIATSGAPVEHPGELLTRGLSQLAAARRSFDVILIDTPPLLATDDAGVLMPLATEVVLLCRVGRTPLDAAERARDLLVRLEAPLTGCVLVGSEQPGSARSYYRSNYRSRRRAADARAGEPVAKPEATPDRVDAAVSVNGAEPTDLVLPSGTDTSEAALVEGNMTDDPSSVTLSAGAGDSSSSAPEVAEADEVEFDSRTESDSAPGS